MRDAVFSVHTFCQMAWKFSWIRLFFTFLAETTRVCPNCFFRGYTRKSTFTRVNRAIGFCKWSRSPLDALGKKLFGMNPAENLLRLYSTADSVLSKSPVSASGALLSES